MSSPSCWSCKQIRSRFGARIAAGETFHCARCHTVHGGKSSPRDSELTDYYEVLQVSPNADSDVIQAAYKRLALKYHPDRNTDPGATRKMQLLNDAYETLSDPDRRRAYDDARKPAADPHPDPPPQPSPAPGSTPSPPVRSDDFATVLGKYVLPVKVRFEPLCYGGIASAFAGALIYRSFLKDTVVEFFVPLVTVTAGAVFALFQTWEDKGAGRRWDTVPSSERNCLIARWASFVLTWLIVVTVWTFFVFYLKPGPDSVNKILERSKSRTSPAGAAKETDDAFRRRLIGSWAGNGSENGIQATWTTTYRADGTWDTATKFTGARGTFVLQIRGTWRVEGGKIRERVTWSSDPTTVPVGDESPEAIVVLNDEELVVRNERGVLVTARRVRP